MRNIILSLIFLILSLFIIGCGNEATNPTTQTLKEYSAIGISSYYIDKGLKFFSVDGKAYTLNFNNGGITGLAKSNDSSPVNFDRSTIYSRQVDGEYIYKDSRIYIIYGNGYEGTIILPYNTSSIGHVRIINSSDHTLAIEGLIGVDRPERKIINQVQGNWTGTSGSDSVTLTIDADFVTMLIGTETYKIPGNFFLSSTTADNNTEHKIYGNYYTLTTISTVNGGVNQYKVLFDSFHTGYDVLIENNKVKGLERYYSSDTTLEFTLTKK
ncbi:hypothetical protein [Brachyspira hampsonii]|uniref:hypothetical protein n=1 Tax=Brachyspira hampsonii TaxID=1287055 RepID=UPI000D34F6C4|nr:hypothetical protein [Brachyspira hampsonii]PTY40968.1 hypothetical protein DQ06_10620 [Brachyspira hampsonii bv. II]